MLAQSNPRSEGMECKGSSSFHRWIARDGLHGGIGLPGSRIGWFAVNSAYDAPLTDPRKTKSASSDPRLRFELLAIAAHNGWLASAVTLIMMTFLCALLYGHGSNATLFAWAAAMVLGAALRVGLSTAWRSGPGRRKRNEALPEAILRLEEVSIRRWEFAHATVGLVCGLAWSLLVFTISPSGERPELGVGSPSERAVFLVGMALTIALLLGNSSYAATRLAYLTFAIPIVIMQEANLLRLGPGFNDLS